MGKHALITGASGGVGRALALQLAGQGITVHALARREGALQELQQQNPAFINILACDVSDADAWVKVQNYCRTIKLDYLIHNAAVIEPVGRVDNIDYASWQQMVKTNIDAPLFLTQALLNNMNDHGRILFVSSGAAFSAYEGIGAYCVSKAALSMVYKAYKHELASSSIQIGCLSPGTVDTGMSDKIHPFPECAAFQKERKAKGTFLRPEQSAEYIAWVLCETNDAVFEKQQWGYNDYSTCQIK